MTRQFTTNKFEAVTDVQIAIINRLEPIDISFLQDNRLNPDSTLIIIPERLNRKTIQLTFAGETQEVVIEEGLQVGDTVAVICYNDYNNFYIDGRV